ncbi:MAG: CbtB-domain containing protein [Pararhodobacter sp.]|nr:CbtB-domain containing protein [Pararhodobacter sp.]
MISTTKIATQSLLAPAFAMAMIGLTAMFVAGHAQSQTMHDAAHDMRHATGFPCH